MSKIFFYLSNSDTLNQCLMSIKKYTDRSLREIKRSLELGEPIAEFIIYENDHDSVSEKIKKLITDLSNQGSHLEIYEVELEEGSEVCDESTKISIETLLNLLDEFDQEREVQRNFSYREF